MPKSVGAKEPVQPTTIAHDQGTAHLMLLSELSEYDGATTFGATTMWAVGFLDGWGKDLGLGSGALAIRKTEVTVGGIDYRVVDVLRAPDDGHSIKGAKISTGNVVAIVIPKDK